jgi:hypothetical protein
VRARCAKALSKFMEMLRRARMSAGCTLREVQIDLL